MCGFCALCLGVVMNRAFKTTLDEIVAGCLSWRIWMLLGWQDIRLRYRRSQLGPFWITISMVITIYTMGFLYGTLLHIELRHYFPFLASGLLTWALISTIVTDSTNCLVEASGYLKQIKIPYIVFACRIVTRHLIIFAHNVLAIIPIIIYFHVQIGWNILALLLGLLLVIVNGSVYGFILGILGARFRDIYQIVISLMQVIFFVTPVIWEAGVLPTKYQFLVKLNPFAQFIDLIRAPIMGGMPTMYAYQVAGIFTIVGIVIMLILFHRVRSRIIYWL